jgi:hypothetical protein
MPVSNIPRGKSIVPLFADESTYGTPPGGNWTPTFIYSWPRGGNRPLEDDMLLGVSSENTRDATTPAPGLPGFDGSSAVVPLDLNHFGYWLKHGMGAESVSGSADPYTHVFKSGRLPLPTRSFELPFTSSWFRQDVGVGVAGFDFDLGRGAGYDRVSVRLIGQKTNKLSTTGGGTPSSIIARSAIAKTIPVAKINGTVAGRVRSLRATFNNGLAEQNFVGNEYISGIDPDADVTCSGTLGIRILDSTYRDLAAAGPPGTSFSLELLWYISATRSFSWLMPAVRLGLEGEPISGPGGFDVDYNFRAEQGASAPMVTATLINSIAAY